ncbi:MAG: hypothetical protein LC776_13760 [Acidobacteria bacterium]|nr:hypothetical protein [Acidobacteriota bacterium]
MTRRNATGMIPRRDRTAIALRLMGEIATAVLNQRAVGASVGPACGSASLGERVVVAIRNPAVRRES